MSLYAIADVHLYLGTDKPMDVFPGWADYVARLEQNWRSVVSAGDTVVVAGDISWAMKLEESRADLAFLHSLPGRKLLLKGNHDLWWSTMRKMEDFLNQNHFDSLSFIHNNAAVVDTVAVCGTRGWFFDDVQSDRKVVAREAGRLERSIEEAKRAGGEPVVFLHYPPVYGGQRCDEMMEVLHRHEIHRCYYGHIHGAGRRQAAQGTIEGIQMRLISCDALGFAPILVEKCPYDASNRPFFE